MGSFFSYSATEKVQKLVAKSMLLLYNTRENQLSAAAILVYPINMRMWDKSSSGHEDGFRTIKSFCKIYDLEMKWKRNLVESCDCKYVPYLLLKTFRECTIHFAALWGLFIMRFDWEEMSTFNIIIHWWLILGLLWSGLAILHNKLIIQCAMCTHEKNLRNITFPCVDCWFK